MSSRQSPHFPRHVAEVRCSFLRSSGLVSALVITEACVQTPPHGDYRGLDRKPHLSAVCFPGSSAVSKPADTYTASSHRLPGAQRGSDGAVLQSPWRLFRSSQICQAGGICSPWEEEHPSLPSPTSKLPRTHMLSFALDVDFQP